MNASSYNDFREHQAMEQMIKFIPGKDGNPGHFISPLPLKPFNINSVKGNISTAEQADGPETTERSRGTEASER